MSTIRVAAISDLHGFLPAVEDFPECDVAVIAGDVCPIDDHSPWAQHRWLERVFAPWLEELQARGAVVVGIAGNHDLIFASETEPFVPYLPWHYLQDSEVELCGLRIVGAPWIPHMGRGWVFQAPESYGGEFLAERFRSIPEGLDILLTHSPPYGFRDVTLEGTHQGSRALLGAIRHKHPRLVVCGHVHEGHGVSMTGGQAGAQTLVANVCARNWDYQVSHPEPMQFLVPPRPGAVEVLR